MAKYAIEEDGVILNTDKSKQSWEEATWWNGNNHISKATKTQFGHEKLFLSKKGRYWVECWSQWQGSTPSARLLSRREAAEWLIRNEHDLPEDLAEFEDEIEE